MPAAAWSSRSKWVLIRSRTTADPEPPMILFELDHFGSIIAVAPATLKLPNRRRIVFSDGRMAASVQLSAVGSEPYSATNSRIAATDSSVRVSAASDSGIASPSNSPGGFALWELGSTKFLRSRSACRRDRCWRSRCSRTCKSQNAEPGAMSTPLTLKRWRFSLPVMSVPGNLAGLLLPVR
jgi:hypothetical protein